MSNQVYPSNLARLAGFGAALALLCSCNSSTSAEVGSCDASGMRKVQLPMIARTAADGATSPRLEAGTPLVTVLRDACSNPGEIASSVPDRFEGRTPSGVRSYEWRLPNEMSLAELERMAASDPCVAMISESRVDELPYSAAGNAVELRSGGSDGDVALPEYLPNDPKVTQQKHLPAIGASEAFDIFFNPGNGIKVSTVIAVIDSGVKLNHEDIKDRLWINEDEVPGNGVDDDQNGYVDDYYGYNFASRIPDPSPQRSSANGSWQWAHGTRVGGLAAATSGNQIGITGTAPNARIMAINAMGTSAGFSQSTIANSIRYATDNGAQVINLSIGGNSGQSADYKAAIEYALSRGVVLFAAAGNENSSIGGSYSAAGLSPRYPGLISVGNYQAATFKKSPQSNHSTIYVELGAPGTYDSGNLLVTTSSESTSSYSGFSGTSASTPVAAGAAALAIGLLESRGYTTTPAMIEKVLLDSAHKVSELTNYFKDGNALHLGSLAELINRQYPPTGRPPVNGPDGKPRPPVTGSDIPAC